MAEVSRVLGIEKTRTTPYHPQADGQVERFNRTLGTMLTAVVAPDQRDWDDHLPFLTAAYCATAHRPPGEDTVTLGRYLAEVVKRLQVGRCPKLQWWWTGPWLVKEVLSL